MDRLHLKRIRPVRNQCEALSGSWRQMAGLHRRRRGTPLGKTGRELFYRNGTKWMSARVQTSPDFAAQKPEVMFEGNFVNVLGIEYDVAPDGNHFIMIQADEPKSPPTELNVIVNWLEELKRQIPAR